MRLIVGLGNPGIRYSRTRHNIGSDVVGALAKAHGITLRRNKYQSKFGEGRLAGKKVAIALPQTYMNLSGGAVLSAMKDKNISSSSILVVCDDADLPLGAIRIRLSGSSGGHKGLTSIMERLGSRSFSRLRIGIGKDKDLKAYVLKPFTRPEAATLNEARERAQDAIACWVAEGIEAAMNKYNRG